MYYLFIYNNKSYDNVLNIVVVAVDEFIIIQCKKNQNYKVKYSVGERVDFV